MKLTEFLNKDDLSFGKLNEQFKALVEQYQQASSRFSELRSGKLDEAMLPVVGDLETQMAELSKRFEAARRGLGLANKLPAHERKDHLRRIMSNMNTIRGMLGQVTKSMDQFNAAEQGYEQGSGYNQSQSPTPNQVYAQQAQRPTNRFMTFAKDFGRRVAGGAEENEEMGEEQMNRWLDCCPRCGNNPCNC